MIFEDVLLEAVAEREERRRVYGDAADLAAELERHILEQRERE